MNSMRRLDRIQQYMEEKGWKFTYREEDELGSIEFIYRDRSYHIWEFCDDDGVWGVESNVKTCGRMDDYTGDYETAILEVIESWLEEERKNAVLQEARDREFLERRINRQW